MKLHGVLMVFVLGFGLAGSAQTQGVRTPPAPPAPDGRQAGVLTTVSGTISQFNYNRDAEIEGFLLSSNTLVHVPPRIAPRLESSVKVGDSVQVSGYVNTPAGGMQTVEAQSVHDATSGKTLTVPQAGAAAPYSGSGRIEQLNYGPGGEVNGFVLDNGTLASIQPFGPGNPSSVRVGAAVTYSGFARTTMSGRTAVDVQTLAVNGQAVSFAAGGPGGPARPPRFSRGGRAVAPPAAPAAPAGGVEEPPPPPAPRPPQS